MDRATGDALLLEYLQGTLGLDGGADRLEEMSAAERDLELGRQTIQKYGCYGCHEIRGFEDAKPIGVELTEEGSKPVHQFDFGFVHDVPHTRHDWIEAKLRGPRRWDEGKERVKDYAELLKMPNFGMSEREAEAVVVNVLGFTKESVVASRKAGQSPRSAALAAGRRIVTYYNCQGCHLIEGRGHAIASALPDRGLLPPNLAAQGARTQSTWLFEFLHDPGRVTLRPWLEARMPTFGFDDEEINRLVGYFAARDRAAPFATAPAPPADRRSLVVGEVAFNMLQCAKCHPAGPVGASGGVVSAGELAPSLLLAPGRLRHDWVPAWIRDPQGFIPGTNMPSNFPKQADGTYQSPLAMAIASPMFAEQKRRLLAAFDSEEELMAYLASAEQVTEALRDHIWWSLPRGVAPSSTAP
jgi:cytochrome c2